jgi:hypothetical protein
MALNVGERLVLQLILIGLAMTIITVAIASIWVETVDATNLILTLSGVFATVLALFGRGNDNTS